MPSLHLEDRIPALCAKALASDDNDFPNVIAELRAAMHQHIENLRSALKQFVGEHERQTLGENNTGETSDGAEGIRQRLRELTAKLATEQDHDKFTALVQEVNQLLDPGDS